MDRVVLADLGALHAADTAFGAGLSHHRALIVTGTANHALRRTGNQLDQMLGAGLRT